VKKELSLLLILLFVSTNFFGQKVSIERTCFNTEWDEYGPRMVNGSFYCLSASFDEGFLMVDPYTKKPFSDLYLINGCKIDHARFNTWEFGEGTSMSSNFYDGPLTGDGSILFFTNNHGLESNVKLGLFYAYENNGKWDNAIKFPFNSLDYNVSHPFYDAKTRKLYFASDKGNTEENQDLYVCSFDGTKFSEPQKINAATSSKNDMAPYFYHGVLYFTSNGHGSMGGYDLFKLKDDKVISMGADFNTIYDDLTIMFESDTSGYFATSRFSKGLEDDIVKFTIRPENESINPIETVQQNLAVKNTPNEQKGDSQNKVDSVQKPLALNSTPIQQLVNAKEEVDSLRELAAKSGVSPDLFAFLDLVLDQYKNNFPQSFSDKPLEDINARIKELKAIINLVNQQIALEKPVSVLANNDAATTFQNTPITLSVLGNDVVTNGEFNKTSIDLDPSKPGIQTKLITEQGTWSAKDGMVTFVALPTFTGNTQIYYTVSDNKGNVSNSAAINVNVTPKIGNPIANNDVASTSKDMPVKVDVLANDIAPNGILDKSTIDLDQNSPGIQTNLNSPQGTWEAKDGKVTFIPAKDFTGNATIPYTIKDINGAISNPASLSVNVSKNTLIVNDENQPMELDLINSIIDQSHIENIQFDFDSYDITPEYKTYLRGLSMLIKANKNWNIHLSGHTDNFGEDKYNLRLSEQRSISAKNFLVSCGVEANRLTYDFFGESRPVASNSTAEGRYKNRRVEIKALIKN
jgi:outer membrane protein OmpA-like peptidoglycan-associated protein